VIKGLEFVLVELKKFKSEKWGERKLAALWLQFLRDVGEDMSELPPELAANEQIRQAAELCEEGAFTPGELEAYDIYWDWVRTEKTIREGSEAKGLAEGHAKGHAEGRAEGVAIGLAKGIEKEKITIALKALEMGMSVKDICKLTGLNQEDVNQLGNNRHTPLS
jgi:flagellar biosynthesis/type III secretory pathway protein FliH